MEKTEPIVVVESVTKSFRIPLEGSSGLKQRMVNAFKRRKGYRVFTPLRDISFEVYPGEFFGIVGKNGSGKSTLLKTLAGIYTPAKGRVHIGGSLVPFIELGVGFNPELTGRENVYLNGALLGFNRKEVNAMYDEIVNFAELGDFMEERLKNYSSGMQVRLAFSIAIQARGDILLLDEVLAVGDAAFQQKCFDYFEELKRDHRTIILVTHDMGAVKRFCDRAMMITDGKIEKIGTPEEVADLYTEENIEMGAGEEGQGTYLTTIFPKKRRFHKSDVLKFEVAAKELDEDCFISVSFVSQGFVFANKNSKYNSKELQLRSAGSLMFSQTLEDFNSGKYDIYISLHRTSNDGLLQHKPRAFSFVVTGKDLSRDGPMRIEGEWLQEK